MSYAEEEWFRRVAALAAKAHTGQLDGCREPYIDHLLRTAVHLVRLYPDATCAEIEAAVIHDIFEDTDTREEDVLAAGVLPEAVAIAREITKPADRDTANFRDYRTRISDLVERATDSALRVKLADNADNRDPRRVERSNSLNRVACKYDPAKVIMEAELAWRRSERAGLIARLG